MIRRRVFRQRLPALATWVLAAGCGAPVEPSEPGPWPSSEPAAQGMDAGLVDDAIGHIRSDVPNVNGIVVVRNGHLVLERYFNRTDRATTHLTGATHSSGGPRRTWARRRTLRPAFAASTSSSCRLSMVVAIATESLQPREPIVDPLHVVREYFVPSTR